MAEAAAAAAEGLWAGRALTAWTFLREQSRTGLALLLNLPTTCKLATIHAGYLCMGENMEYTVTPGFPPLSLSWGWLLVGILVGALLMLLGLLLFGMIRREPSIAALARMQAPDNQADQAQQDLIRYISRGRPALQEMAAISGCSEIEVLRRAYAVPQLVAHPPGLVFNGQRMHM